MQIEFQRSGGVAGLTPTASIDSDALSAEDADSLCKLVEDAGFFDLPAEITGSQAQPDRFVYTVTVKTDALRHTVRVDESAAPPTLQALLDWLNRAARRRGRGSDR